MGRFNLKADQLCSEMRKSITFILVYLLFTSAFAHEDHGQVKDLNQNGIPDQESGEKEVSGGYLNDMSDSMKALVGVLTSFSATGLVTKYGIRKSGYRSLKEFIRETKP